MELGEDWRAVQCAQRAVQVQPGWAAGHLTLARAQLNYGVAELALRSMELVLRLDPGHAEASMEVQAVRALVLQQRRQQQQLGGGSGGMDGQRARVQPTDRGGGPLAEKSYRG